MNTKILASVMVIALVGSVAGAGTFAYFSDTETSTGNILRAGNLNLEIDTDDNDHFKVELINMAPGEWTGFKRLDLENGGTLDAWVDDIHVSDVTENDVGDGIAAGTLDSKDMGPDQFDDKVLVKVYNENQGLIYDGTVHDLKSSNAIPQGQEQKLDTSYYFKFALAGNAGPNYQNDGIDVTFSITAVQESQK